MKRIFYPLLAICALTFIFFGCNKELSDQIVKYKGQVVYLGTSEPFPNVEVKLTDGGNINTSVLTDAGGFFSMKVDVSTINGAYYILAGDSTCIPKKVNLPGYGQAEIDLGVIEVEGPHVPTVKTLKPTSVTADAVVMGGIVESDGRMHVNQRGVCYAKTTDPTIDDLHTINGEGLGEFVSNLTKLEYNTIYYARAYAINKKGVAYGEQVKFTTEEGVAIVITDSVYKIMANSVRVKAHVESDGGFAVTKRGVCWSKTADPTLDDDFTNEGSGVGEFTSAIKNLTENTTYYIRSFATNQTKTSYGEQFKITTLDGMPIVECEEITDITSNSIVCQGIVVSDCDIPVLERGFVYSTNQYPTIENAGKISVGKGLGTYTTSISKLERDTKYYIRAYATNTTGTAYSEQKSITTLDGMPAVSKVTVSDIAATSVVCKGEVLSDCGVTVSARGFVYGTTPLPTLEGDNVVTNGRGLGQYSSSISGLTPSTSYYVRTYATNASGTIYGAQQSFTTTDGLPTIGTNVQVTDIQASHATFSGNIQDAGGASLTACGVCWSSTSATPTITDSHSSEVPRTGQFTSQLINLSPSTTYYARAYATNQFGTSYSNVVTFTTLDGLPVVETLDPGENITISTIIASGHVIDNSGYTISERGFVFSTFSNPTIETANKVVSSSTNDYFSGTISGVDFEVQSYYVRAYATNANGTSYGNQIYITQERYQYTLLPRVVFRGETYVVYYSLGMVSFPDAVNACNSLTYGGYSDWSLPTIEALQQIVTEVASGWRYEAWDRATYWSGSLGSLDNGGQYAYALMFYEKSGAPSNFSTMRVDLSGTVQCNVRPVRKITQ